MITKTRYLDFLECPKNAWLRINKPNEFKEIFELSEGQRSLAKQGERVELEVRKLFPQGELIKDLSNDDAVALTKEHIAWKTPVIFQAAFQVDQYFIRVDVLEFDKQNQVWNMYEVKTGSEVKKIHIDDVAFQQELMTRCGINVGEIFIIHLNAGYVFDGGDIDLEQLLVRSLVTGKVKGHLDRTNENMESSLKLLQNNESLVHCLCIYKGRNNHCLTFSYSHPYVPECSVHDIPYIGKSDAVLKNLVDEGNFKLEDMPNDIRLKFSDTKQKQIESYCKQKPLIKVIDLAKELEMLKSSYPLYFLDYETYALAIPRFKGYRPNQQIVVQLSLHILRSADDSHLEHFEYLHKEDSDPALSIINTLRQHIGDEGKIVVWNKSFESSCHTKLGQMYSEHAGFLEGLNKRMYDLKDIFSESQKAKRESIYIHPDFNMSASIKCVLPVLVPELSYQDLGIQEGEAASHNWYKMIYGDLSKEQQSSIAQDLLQYCKTDTLAMYKIFEHLIKTIQQ